MGINAFTRRLLLIDAATCLGAGLLLTLAAAPLEPLLGLPRWLLLEAGIMLFPCALFAAWAGRRVGAASWPARLMAGLNTTWTAGSLLLLTLGWTTPLGTGFVLAQAVAVAAIAGAQLYSLRPPHGGMTATPV